MAENNASASAASTSTNANTNTSTNNASVNNAGVSDAQNGTSQQNNVQMQSSGVGQQQNTNQNVTTQQTQQIAQGTTEGTGLDLYSNQEPSQQQQQQVVVPEKYTLIQSDGQPISSEDMARADKIFRTAGLTQEQAQAIISEYEKDTLNMQEQIRQNCNAQTQKWKNDIAQDPTLGGANLAKTKMNVGRVMQKYGNGIAGLSELLNQSGLGYHPAFVQLMNRIGEGIGNDTNFINGHINTPRDTELDKAKRLYSNSPSLF